MKIISGIVIITFIVTLLISCLEGKKQGVEMNTPAETELEKTTTPERFDQSFSDEMTGAVWSYYSKIRMALVNSDPSSAARAAGDLEESFGDRHKSLKTIAQHMAGTNELTEQRRLFSDLSKGVETIFKNSIEEGAIYKQFCPMAFNNQGANWFSEIREIENPYFGEKMMHCGSVTEVIRKSQL